MACDHQIFVRWDNTGGCAACGPGDPWSARGIGGGVELDAKPGRFPAPAPDLRGMLADAGRENKRIEPAKRGGKRTKLAADAIDEEIDRFLRVRISDASRARMSSLKPETPKRPEH